MKRIGKPLSLIALGLILFLGIWLVAHYSTDEQFMDVAPGLGLIGTVALVFIVLGLCEFADALQKIINETPPNKSKR
jgi:hypothetical protein